MSLSVAISLVAIGLVAISIRVVYVIWRTGKPLKGRGRAQRPVSTLIVLGSGESSIAIAVHFVFGILIRNVIVLTRLLFVCLFVCLLFRWPYCRDAEPFVGPADGQVGSQILHCGRHRQHEPPKGSLVREFRSQRGWFHFKIFDFLFICLRGYALTC